MNHKLRSALFSANELVKQINNYSYASQADMRHMLHRTLKDLHELGFKVSHLQGLKPKHIHVLVEHWKKQEKRPATIKNYMAKLRKMAKLLDKPSLIKPSNDDYGIAQRTYIPTHNKAINQVDFSKCTEPFIRLSIEAQSLFGLRREESMKLVLSEAWHGNYLTIKPSWTKGGIGRTLEITNPQQRQWLLKAVKQVPKGLSFIPKDRTYKQHLSHYQIQTKKMDLHKCHGLRHAYAQQRYHELTQQFDRQQKGLLCPIAGGKSTKLLSKEEKRIDKRAREIVSRELGHSRLAITRCYLG